MKKGAKIVLISVLVLILGGYGYYSYLSYQIYKEVEKYRFSENPAAVETAKKIIQDKYPYSIFYFKL